MNKQDNEDELKNMQPIYYSRSKYDKKKIILQDINNVIVLLKNKDLERIKIEKECEFNNSK